MNHTVKFIIGVIVATLFCSIGYIKWHHHTTLNQQSLFKTEQLTKKTIKQIVNVSGVLEIKDTMPIASIKDGTISDVRVKLNEHVKKGQVLAIVQTTVGNTEYQEALHDCEKAQREYDYQKAYFARQKELYNAGHLAKNTYESLRKTYQQAHDEYKKNQATLQKKKEDFNCTYIKAPTDGIVIAVDATKGKALSTYTTTNIFEIAHDIHDMQATLEIDESDIGMVKKGQRVTLIPNAFPERKIKTTINEISYVPKIKADSDATTVFKALANVTNTDGSLRPGMIVNAKVKVNKVVNALCITGLAFDLNNEALKVIAQKCGYQYLPITKTAIKELKKHYANDICRVVWVVENKKFIQKIIRLGITDDTHWQVISGLGEHDKVITDIEETNELEELLKKHSATF